jgi:hypothetical protein
MGIYEFKSPPRNVESTRKWSIPIRYVHIGIIIININSWF